MPFMLKDKFYFYKYAVRFNIDMIKEWVDVKCVKFFTKYPF